MKKFTFAFAIAAIFGFSAPELGASSAQHSRFKAGKHHAGGGHQRAHAKSAKKAPAPQAKAHVKNKGAAQPISHSSGNSAKAVKGFHHSRFKDGKRHAGGGHQRAHAKSAKKAPAPQAKAHVKNKGAAQPISHSSGNSAKAVKGGHHGSYKARNKASLKKAKADKKASIKRAAS